MEFLHFFRQKSYVETLRQELTDSIRRQRAELDHFAATLEDMADRVTRYRQENYRALTPPHWEVRDVKKMSDLNRILERFWKDGTE